METAGPRDMPGNVVSIIVRMLPMSSINPISTSGMWQKETVAYARYVKVVDRVITPWRNGQLSGYVPNPENLVTTRNPMFQSIMSFQEPSQNRAWARHNKTYHNTFLKYMNNGTGSWIEINGRNRNPLHNPNVAAPVLRMNFR